MSVYQSAPTLEQAAITAKDFNFWYGDFHALTGLDLNIAKKPSPPSLALRAAASRRFALHQPHE